MYRPVTGIHFDLALHQTINRSPRTWMEFTRPPFMTTDPEAVGNRQKLGNVQGSSGGE